MSSIQRIVKMSFKPESVGEFLGLFSAVRDRIRNFEGCEGVSLLRDLHNPGVFFTYSTWKSEDALHRYRRSALFDATWVKTKALFNDKPEAWSLEIADKA